MWTLNRFRTAFHRPELFDYTSWEQWSTDGAASAEQRSSTAWKALLERYEQPYLDPAVDEELKEHMARRRQTMHPSDYE